LRPGARNLAALVVVAAGLLIGGCGSDSQESEDEIVQNGIEQINESMDQVSSAAANGLAIHNAELQLQLKGYWNRFDIKDVRAKGADLAIITRLRADGAAARGEATKICRFLLGTGLTLADPSGRIVVTTKDLEPIASSACLQQPE
jgi:hypothetical protein